MPCNSRVVDGCGNVDKADRESPNRGSGQVLRVGHEEDPADRSRLEPSGNSRGFLSCRAWTGLGEDLLARHPQIAREPGRRVVGDVGCVLNLPNDRGCGDPASPSSRTIGSPEGDLPTDFFEAPPIWPSRSSLQTITRSRCNKRCGTTSMRALGSCGSSFHRRRRRPSP